MTTTHTASTKKGAHQHENHEAVITPEERSRCASSPVAPHQRESFRGYTLQQIRYRKAVTQLKIEVTKDKIGNFTTSKVKTDVAAVKSYFFSFENIMRYVDYGILGYNVFKRFNSIMRAVGLKKKKH